MLTEVNSGGVELKSQIHPLREITLLVTGGRDFTDFNAMCAAYVALRRAGYIITRIVHGGATGADALAERLALMFNIPFKGAPANWDLYGDRAGRIRNCQMLREEKPDMVLAMPGGNGTDHMVRIAREAFVPVVKRLPSGRLVRSGGIGCAWFDFNRVA